MSGLVVLPTLSVPIGVLLGLLIANEVSGKRSAWPYIAGIVALGALVVVVATWHG